MRYEKRLHALEAKMRETRAPAWGMVEPLRCALTEAVRAKIARRLDGEADTPAQVAHHAALLDQWRAAHGLMGEATGARARIAARLDQMAARQHANATVA
jgi:hypothetical protein